MDGVRIMPPLEVRERLAPAMAMRRIVAVDVRRWCAYALDGGRRAPVLDGGAGAAGLPLAVRCALAASAAVARSGVAGGEGGKLICWCLVEGGVVDPDGRPGKQPSVGVHGGLAGAEGRRR